MTRQYITKPIEISRDKRLTFAEQDYLCLIWQLSKRKCTASNRWFADYFGVERARASEIICSLRDKGIIKVTIQRDGKEVVERTINVIDKAIKKTFTGVSRKPLQGIKDSPDLGIKDLGDRGIKDSPEAKVKNKLKDKVKDKKRAGKVTFDSDRGAFTGIDITDYQRWAKAYPGIDLYAETAKAAEWLVRKDETRQDYRLFLAGWFRRSKPTQPLFDESKFDPSDDDVEQLRKAGVL